MPNTLFLAPAGPAMGYTSIAMGLVRALDRIGLRVSFLKPISSREETPDRSVALIRQTTALTPQTPLARAEALTLYRRDPDQLMEEVVKLHQAAAEGADVVIVEGLMSPELKSSGGRFCRSRSPPQPKTVMRRRGPSSRRVASTFSSASGVCA